MSETPSVLPLRERADVIHRNLRDRLDNVLPAAMREAGIDMWLVICQEDNPDPVFTTMIPMDTWPPILQILLFFDRGEADGVERINISRLDSKGLFESPWSGRHHQEQWPLLRQAIEDRDPKRIGINTGSVQWAAGGLTHNLHRQLVEALPEKYVGRLVDAEPAATRWLATLTAEEIRMYAHVVDVAKHLMAECYGRNAVTPNRTTIQDLQWTYWQGVADLGLEIAFKPYFYLWRRDSEVRRLGEADEVIRPGDLIHCDVGIKYLRLNSDHQQWAYVLGEGETDAPEGMRQLLGQVHRLQDVFMSEFQLGLTGNEMLANILTRARAEGVPNPKVYSHSLGLYLHEPGPLVGLPWEQKCCPGRGDVALQYGNAFTMELSASDAIAEWDGQTVDLSVEEDVVFTESGCHLIGPRQERFHLI